MFKHRRSDECAHFRMIHAAALSVKPTPAAGRVANGAPPVDIIARNVAAVSSRRPGAGAPLPPPSRTRRLSLSTERGSNNNNRNSSNVNGWDATFLTASDFQSPIDQQQEQQEQRQQQQAEGGEEDDDGFDDLDDLDDDHGDGGREKQQWHPERPTRGGSGGDRYDESAREALSSQRSHSQRSHGSNDGAAQRTVSYANDNGGIDVDYADPEADALIYENRADNDADWPYAQPRPRDVRPRARGRNGPRSQRRGAGQVRGAAGSAVDDDERILWQPWDGLPDAEKFRAARLMFQHAQRAFDGTLQSRGNASSKTARSIGF
jgi:hypothetical protein